MYKVLCYVWMSSMQPYSVLWCTQTAPWRIDGLAYLHLHQQTHGPTSRALKHKLLASDSRGRGARGRISLRMCR